jgi:hypothetical protein
LSEFTLFGMMQEFFGFDQVRFKALAAKAAAEPGAGADRAGTC